MKRIAAAIVLAAFMFGCSDNTVMVENRSQFGITLNFRAKSYFLQGYDLNNPNSTFRTTHITGIPNGTFAYGTVYTVQPNEDVTAGDGLAGTLTFERSETQILLIYGSNQECDDSTNECTHYVWATASSNQPTGAIMSP